MLYELKSKQTTPPPPKKKSAKARSQLEGQVGKDTFYQAWQLEFNPLDPCGGQREEMSHVARLATSMHVTQTRTKQTLNIGKAKARHVSQW